MKALPAANARRVLGASWLALAEVAYLLGGLIWFGTRQALAAVTVLAFLGLTLLGLAAAVLCYALSVLILQAAEMKEEADLTI